MEHHHIKLYILLCIISIILFVSLLTNKWSVLNNSNKGSSMGINAGESGNLDIGIWRSCGNFKANINIPIPNININNMNSKDININANANSCISNTDSNFTPIKILSVIGLVLIIAAIILLYIFPEQHIYSLIAILFGGLSSLVTAIIWNTNKNLKPIGTDLGSSWYLQLVGSILAIITGLLMQLNILDN